MKEIVLYLFICRAPGATYFACEAYHLFVYRFYFWLSDRLRKYCGEYAII